MTDTIKVSVERQVEQVKDGTDYKGFLKLAGVQLDFELKFGVPINKLDDTEVKINSLDDMMRVFQISITKDGEKVEIDDDEYSLFFSLLVEHTINFYNLPQTRDTNEGLVGKMMRGQGLFAGSSASILVTDRVTASFDSEVQGILSNPKFGCVFA